MIFITFNMKNIFNFLIFTFLLVSCTSKVEKEKPVREISLPKGSFWIGNANDGNWFKIDEIDNKNKYVKIIDIIKFWLHTAVCQLPNTFGLRDNFRFNITAPSFMIVKRTQVDWSWIINFKNTFVYFKICVCNFT